MERKFNFSEGEYYHIYNRGSEKREIFTCPEDYTRFLGLLYLANSKEPISFRDVARGLPSGKNINKLFNYDREKTIVDIGAYCLMPNHFHLILREKEGGGISKFILKICTAYSMYFNKKYEHSGSLFQGPYKAEHLGEDNYLKYMYAYSHLNPIKLIDHDWKEKGIKDLTKARNYLLEYPHSSYVDYLGVSRPEGRILSKEAFPEYFSDKKEFEDFINDWLEYRDDEEEESSDKKSSV